MRDGNGEKELCKKTKKKCREKIKLKKMNKRIYEKLKRN